MNNNKEQIEKTEKKQKNFRLNRWSIFGLIALSSLIMVFYVNNVLEVNKLLKDCRVLENNLKNLKSNNLELNSKLIKLQSPERICQIAQSKLGLQRNEEIPEIIRAK
ncbi:MAG: hypothetical protein HW421_3704 [Ignavibacteria bacterium]|nr:hypothetical protein [Ignavibacteria bacterium]